MDIQQMAGEYLQAGIEAHQQGKFDLARTYLAAAVRADPDSGVAWLWLSRCVTDPGQRRYCLQKALALDPENLEIKSELKRPVGPADPTPPATVAVPAAPVDPAVATAAAFTTQIDPRKDPPPPKAKPVARAKPTRAGTAQEWLAVLLGACLGILLIGAPLAWMAFAGQLDQFVPGLAVPMQQTQAALLAPATAPVLPSQTLTPTTAWTATPTSTRRPPTATPTLDPTQDYLVRRAHANLYINTAKGLMDQGKCAEAIAYWDLALSAYPEYREGYHHRAQCYMSLLENQRSYNEYADYLHIALEDLDTAIALGPPYGDQYLDRARVYRKLVGLEEYTVDMAYYSAISLENRQAAVHLGNSTAHSEYQIPYILIEMNRCQEGLVEAQKLIDRNPALADQDFTFANMQSNGLLCLGRLDQALSLAEKAIRISPATPANKLLRAIILYQMGRQTAALEQINELIEADPYYSGFRYYLRAMIYYDQGNLEQAEDDLYRGAGNTWGRGELYAYLQARFALDNGDREEGIRLLQFAEATSSYLFNPLRDKMRKELAALGAEPLDPELAVAITATPLPPALLVPPPTSAAPAPPEYAPSIPTPAGVNLPENAAYAIVASLEDGSGPITLLANDYPLFRFKPKTDLSIKFVQSMTFTITSSQGTGPTTMQLSLWDAAGGGWRMIDVVWGENTIQYPDDRVYRNGEIYVALRNWGEQLIDISNMGFSMVIETTGGGISSYGLK
jgi:tetratricopeptide (TPR) repeat protein